MAMAFFCKSLLGLGIFVSFFFHFRHVRKMHLSYRVVEKEEVRWIRYCFWMIYILQKNLEKKRSTCGVVFKKHLNLQCS